MKTEFKYTFVRQLFELTGEVGHATELNPKNAELAELYLALTTALDECETSGLVTYFQEC